MNLCVMAPAIVSGTIAVLEAQRRRDEERRRRERERRRREEEEAKRMASK